MQKINKNIAQLPVPEFFPERAENNMGKETMLVTDIFSFSPHIFKWLLFQFRKDPVLLGNSYQT